MSAPLSSPVERAVADRPAGALTVAAGGLGRLVTRTTEAVCVVLVAADFVLVLVSIFYRYVLNDSLQWSEEMARLLLMGVAFLGAALAYPRREHVSLAFLLARLSRPARAGLDAGIALLVAGLAGLVCHAELTQFMPLRMQLVLPATSLPQGVFSIPVVVGTGILAAYALVDALRAGWRPLGAGLAGALVLVGLGTLIAQAAVAADLASPLLIAWLAFLVTLLAGVPTAFALLLGGLAYVVLQGRTPLLFLPQRIEAGVDSFVLLAVPFFILAGKVMEESSISTRLLGLVRLALGRMRGGTGMVSVGGMYLFSGISGSPTADVSAVGSVMIEPLRQEGYKGGEAVGILSAATIMGQTVPPSIGMVVLGQVTSLSIGTLFVAGFVPAAAMAVVLAGFIYLRSYQLNLRPPPPIGRAEALSTLRRGLAPAVIPVLLFGGMVSGVITPTEIAVIAVLVSVLLALGYQDVDARALARQTLQAATITGMVLLLLGTANTLAVASTFERMPHAIAAWVATFASERWQFMLVSFVVLVVVGALIEFPALIIFGPLLLPVATTLGVDPIHFAICTLIALIIGAFLPPIGLLFYVACGIARVPLGEATAPVLLYILVMVVGWLFVAFVPALTTILPRLLGLAS